MATSYSGPGKPAVGKGNRFPLGRLPGAPIRQGLRRQKRERKRLWHGSQSNLINPAGIQALGNYNEICFCVAPFQRVGRVGVEPEKVGLPCSLTGDPPGQNIIGIKLKKIIIGLRRNLPPKLRLVTPLTTACIQLS